MSKSKGGIQMKGYVIGIIVAIIIFIICVASCSSGGSSSSNYSSSNSSYSSSTSSSKSSSSGGHKCYVCGESGNIKYGSHYYCSTHYAMTKTIVDSME